MSGDVMDEVWISPSRQFGRACVGGTRVPVAIIAEAVWREGVDAAVDDYEVTRRQILNACWFAATYDLLDSVQRRRGPWRRRWGAWAEQEGRALWESDGNPNDPPIEEEA